MLRSSDLIRLPYTPDLTQGGIGYVCRLLPVLQSWENQPHLSLLQNYIADKAVELALRRYLNTLEIPHNSLCVTPLSDPNHFDILMGGYRCLIKTQHIFERDEIRKLRSDPACLLNRSFTFNADDQIDGILKYPIIYIFTLTTSLIAKNPCDQEKAQSHQQPFYWIHITHLKLKDHKQVDSYGPGSLISKSSRIIHLELGGYGFDNKFYSERIHLSPHCRTVIGDNFKSLAYLHAQPCPDGQISIEFPKIKLRYDIPPYRWDNLWVYGMDIILCGYTLHHEIFPGSIRGPLQLLYNKPTLPSPSSTSSRQLEVPFVRLHPMQDLFSRIHDWSQRRGSK
ncbi:MAG: hypothetical protein IBX69_06600 [Anaerolineales bacterium]|nr:hypothetical protein [Anaerolineales bacterium]